MRCRGSLPARGERRPGQASAPNLRHAPGGGYGRACRRFRKCLWPGGRAGRAGRAMTSPNTSPQAASPEDSAWLFNAPPGWPPAPPGWQPAPGWQPDPSWPPAPAGWEFWLPAPQGGQQAGPDGPAAGQATRAEQLGGGQPAGQYAEQPADDSPADAGRRASAPDRRPVLCLPARGTGPDRPCARQRCPGGRADRFPPARPHGLAGRRLGLRERRPGGHVAARSAGHPARGHPASGPDARVGAGAGPAHRGPVSARLVAGRRPRRPRRPPLRRPTRGITATATRTPTPP